eukprot:COSAG05_NODE_18516_length_307_cov_0.740385_1_plen_71_part_01
MRWYACLTHGACVGRVGCMSAAIDKLESAQEALEDEDPEDNYQELATFACGMSRNLKSAGARASAHLKGQL